MVHLENRKQQLDVIRIMKMNKSLASFMDSSQDERTRASSEEPPNEEPYPTTPDEPCSRRSSTGRSSEDELPIGNRGRDYSQVFGRASTLLRQSLALYELGGGVIFLDTAPRSSGRSSTAQRPSHRVSGPKRNSFGTNSRATQSSRTPSDDSGYGDECRKALAAILACSVCVSSFGKPDQTCQLNDKTPANIPVKTLLKFIKRIPGGQVYHYPELHDGSISDPSGPIASRHQSNNEEIEIRTLFSHLPGAHELIFVPLWNTHLGRWTVCIVYTLSAERNFTFEIDYFFCRAFCNCVKAEIDRCTVILSDQQKGDFIGSVSHEL
jgi:hypothetical protein